MEIEISEVLEILRRPLPSNSVLEFIVSKDGYKRIIEDREKCNRKYRVWYDGETLTVTINCCPSYLHEHTSLMVIDSMVDEAVRLMGIAGVSAYVISRVKKAGHLTSSSLSRKKSYKEPGGLIIFDDLECIDAHRIAFEIGFSQSYSSLYQATLWWIEQKAATVAVLLRLTEVGKGSREAHRVFRTIQDRNAEMQTYASEFMVSISLFIDRVIRRSSRESSILCSLLPPQVDLKRLLVDIAHLILGLDTVYESLK